VEEGQTIAELKSSSLESDIIETEDMVREVEANLRRLKAGARPWELEAAKDRVRRLTEWYELGADELQQARLAHEQELLVQDHRIREITAELENARQDIEHSENLYRQGALAGAQLRQQRRKLPASNRKRPRFHFVRRKWRTRKIDCRYFRPAVARKRSPPKKQDLNEQLTN
jgi:multidrug efflux pump subunit AcrA (membrane-fusion protein)